MRVGVRSRRGTRVRMATGALLVVVYLFPVYWMLATSLKASADIFAVPPQLVPSPIDAGSYSDAVAGNSYLLRAIVNSTVIAGGTVALTLLLAAPAAYALAHRRLRFTILVTLLLLLAQVLPTINLALPLFLILSRVGLVDSYTGLILANTTLTVPLAIVILRPFFLSIPAELVDAARVDGCTRTSAFRRIVLPLARPGLVTVGALTFVAAWGEFVFGLTLATSDEMHPVTVALNQFTGQYGTRWNDLMAVSAVVAAPVIVLFAALQRHVIGGLTAGATKG
jgi:multiple sugar transport system permease protein